MSLEDAISFLPIIAGAISFLAIIAGAIGLTVFTVRTRQYAKSLFILTFAGAVMLAWTGNSLLNRGYPVPTGPGTAIGAILMIAGLFTVFGLAIVLSILGKRE